MLRWVRGLCFAFSLSACGVGISEPIPTIVVQPPVLGAGQPMLYTQSASISPKDTGPASTVNLQSLTFSLVSGSSTPNFDFVSSMKVYVSSAKLPQVEVAELSSVPAGAKTVSLNPEPGVNLQAYLSAGCSIDIVLTGTFPAQSVSLDGEIDAWAGM
jgi:hypothetical protein